MVTYVEVDDHCGGPLDDSESFALLPVVHGGSCLVHHRAHTDLATLGQPADTLGQLTPLAGQLGLDHGAVLPDGLEPGEAGVFLHTHVHGLQGDGTMVLTQLDEPVGQAFELVSGGQVDRVEVVVIRADHDTEFHVSILQD